MTESGKVVVIGGGGFLGRHIVELLQQTGREVEVVGRRVYPWLVKRGVRSHCVDICNRAQLSEVLSGVEEVHHTAARVGVWGRHRDFYETNVIGTENVVAACHKNRVSRLVFTSSPSVVFDGLDQEGVDESVPYPRKFLTHYAQTKMLAEQMVLRANGERGLQSCALRPHLIWGADDPHLIPRIIERGRLGKLLQVGDGKNRVAVVHVENAARAHLLAAQELEGTGKCGGKAYFISQAEPVLLWEFIAEILRRASLPAISRSVSVKNAYRLGTLLEALYRVLRLSGEPRLTRFTALQLGQSHYYDISAAKRDFGYQPLVSTEEGLARLFPSNFNSVRSLQSVV